MDFVSGIYRVGGFTCGALAIYLAFHMSPSEVTYEPVAGIAVFAVLYVIAQAVERVIEWFTDLLKLVPKSPGETKQTALRTIRFASSTTEGLATKVAQAKEAEAARTDILFLTHGLAILFSVLLVTWLNYGIMSSLGASNVDAELDRLLTALAAAGGSKGLHELIGRVQAAKENAQTTGG